MQQQILERLDAQGGRAEMAELVAHFQRDPRNVATGIVRLVRRGLVERLESGRYQITESGRLLVVEGQAIRSGPKRRHTGQRAQHLSTSRQQIWRALRVMRKASTLELAAATGASRDNVRKYLGVLALAGYVAKLKPDAAGHARFALVDDTGPLCPIHRPQLWCVLDRNSGDHRELPR
jgi:DNA-binding IclR family transcriptional regulator